MTWVAVMHRGASLLPTGALLIFVVVRATLLIPLPISATGLQVPAEEQRAVLSKRQGSTLSRRSILKSYHAHSGPTALQLPGVPNLRMARGLPVFTVGSISVQGMRRCGTVTARGVFLSGCLLERSKGLQPAFSRACWVGLLYAEYHKKGDRPVSMSRLLHAGGS